MITPLLLCNPLAIQRIWFYGTWFRRRNVHFWSGLLVLALRLVLGFLLLGQRQLLLRSCGFPCMFLSCPRGSRGFLRLWHRSLTNFSRWWKCQRGRVESRTEVTHKAIVRNNFFVWYKNAAANHKVRSSNHWRDIFEPTTNLPSHSTISELPLSKM